MKQYVLTMVLKDEHEEFSNLKDVWDFVQDINCDELEFTSVEELTDEEQVTEFPVG